MRAVKVWVPTVAVALKTSTDDDAVSFGVEYLLFIELVHDL